MTRASFVKCPPGQWDPSAFASLAGEAPIRKSNDVNVCAMAVRGSRALSSARAVRGASESVSACAKGIVRQGGECRSSASPAWGWADSRQELVALGLQSWLACQRRTGLTMHKHAFVPRAASGFVEPLRNHRFHLLGSVPAWVCSRAFGPVPADHSVAHRGSPTRSPDPSATP